jgi:hypothetical protein
MSEEISNAVLIHELRTALDLALDELDRHRHAFADAARVLLQKDAQIGVLDAKLGAAHAELTILRELAEDVARWRESGDGRDLAYVLETDDKMKARNQ